MVKEILPASGTHLSANIAVLDVRSPGEYAQGHIWGALNFPLFSDAERAEVGTLYKQVSPAEAVLRGLEIVGPKMADLVRLAAQLSPNKRVTLYCWRGGQRSRSVAWLLHQAGFEVGVVTGGYKAYRAMQAKVFEATDFKFVRLAGPTGSGKTQILHALRNLGAQVLDLEALAAHRGSAFGWIGQKEQPSAAHFENLLFEALAQFDRTKTIWVEDESKGIGRVFLPKSFWDNFVVAPMVLMEVPKDIRVTHLVHIYANENAAELCLAFEKLFKKLAERTQIAQRAVVEGNLEFAAAIALQYYDKAYAHSLVQNGGPVLFSLEATNLDFDAIAHDLLQKLEALDTNM